MTHSVPTRHASDLEKEKHYKIHMLAGIFFMSGPARSGRCDSPAEQGAGGSRTGMGGPGPLCVCPISPFIGRLGSWRSAGSRSEEHTSERQSLLRIPYSVFCFKKQNAKDNRH